MGGLGGPLAGEEGDRRGGKGEDGAWAHGLWSGEGEEGEEGGGRLAGLSYARATRVARGGGVHRLRLQAIVTRIVRDVNVR
ncbi:MAG: hypothetical protein AMXMBFR55_09220 [Gemmatimonadota bacterium]